MDAKTLDYFEQIIPDLRYNQVDYRGTCPACGRRSLRLRIYGPNEVEPTCETPGCGPQRIKAACSRLWRERNGVNGAEPAAGASVGKRATPSVASVAFLTPKRKSAEPPEDLEPEVYHGLPGEVMLAIEPHTESHPAAILGSFLAGAGCLLGRGPHVYRDGARHAANEFLCLIGRSAVGRKGTATRRTDEVFLDCIGSNYTKRYYMRGTEEGSEGGWDDFLLRGLGSGEAMVEALADDELTGGRKVVFQEEFSDPLKVMRRDGSTLSEKLRTAWDGGTLSNRTKGKQLVARGYHLSVLAHTTESELREQMKGSDVLNGFGNRFLWLATRRVKYLPFGGGDAAIAPVVSRLHEVLEISQRIDRVEFDAEVRELWDQGGLYRALTERPDNFYGVVTSRAEAHVTRLSLFWSLMDGLAVIQMPHLLAALALWDYNERTCQWLFGESSGDEYADMIEELLWEAHPGYLTRTEIRDHFKRHAPPGRIPRALETLEKQGRAQRAPVPTEGRPAEGWIALECQKSDRSDKSPLQRARDWVNR